MADPTEPPTTPTDTTDGDFVIVPTGASSDTVTVKVTGELLKLVLEQLITLLN